MLEPPGLPQGVRGARGDGVRAPASTGRGNGRRMPRRRSGLFIFLLLTLLSYVVFRLRNRLRAKALEKGNMEVDDYNAILDERSTAEDEVPTPFGDQTSVELSPVSKASEAAETYKIEFEDIRLFSGAAARGSHLISLGRSRAPRRHHDHARAVGLLPPGHVDGDHGRVGRGQDDDHELARARVLEPRAKIDRR